MGGGDRELEISMGNPRVTHPLYKTLYSKTFQLLKYVGPYLVWHILNLSATSRCVIMVAIQALHSILITRGNFSTDSENGGNTVTHYNSIDQKPRAVIDVPYSSTTVAEENSKRYASVDM